MPDGNVDNRIVVDRRLDRVRFPILRQFYGAVLGVEACLIFIKFDVLERVRTEEVLFLLAPGIKNLAIELACCLYAAA